MVSDRPYQKKRSYEEALKEIVINAGKRYDPVLAEAFERVVRKEMVKGAGQPQEKSPSAA